jgi:hypothetical protein
MQVYMATSEHEFEEVEELFDIEEILEEDEKGEKTSS